MILLSSKGVISEVMRLADYQSKLTTLIIMYKQKNIKNNKYIKKNIVYIIKIFITKISKAVSIVKVNMNYNSHE